MKYNTYSSRLKSFFGSVHLVIQFEQNSWLKVRIYMNTWTVENGLSGQRPGKSKIGRSEIRKS